MPMNMVDVIKKKHLDQIVRCGHHLPLNLPRRENCKYSTMNRGRVTST